MNETEYDLYMDNIEYIHDKEDWENSLESRYSLGLCDHEGTPIPQGDTW